MHVYSYAETANTYLNLTIYIHDGGCLIVHPYILSIITYMYIVTNTTFANITFRTKPCSASRLTWHSIRSYIVYLYTFELYASFPEFSLNDIVVHFTLCHSKVILPVTRRAWKIDLKQIY